MPTLVENIARAIEDFDSIQASINARGIQTPVGTPTSEYADKINRIGRVLILFYDWDDVLIGALSVPQGAHDIRALVNDYVRDNLIHPDLRNRTAQQLASLDRIDTYRGQYPAEGPEGALIREDGADYPLTNKLEYVFYGKGIDPDYPYVSGWVQVAPETLADTWTALEVGGTIATYDFAEGVDVDVLHLKAAYKPGTWIDGGGSVYYTSLGSVSCLSLSLATASITGSGDYSISFQYARINEDGYGVARLFRPALQRTIRIVDGDNVANMPIFLENNDLIDVSMFIHRPIAAIEYQLVEATKSLSVSSGSQRSEENNFGIFTNFANGAQGDPGFVFEGSLAAIVQTAYKAYQAELTTNWATVGVNWNQVTFTDANLKYTAAGGAIAASNVAAARGRVIQVVQAAVANGDNPLALTYYQLQWYIINQEYLGAEAAKQACIDAGYFWVHSYPAVTEA